MKPAQLGNDKIRVGRAFELDGDIGLQPCDVGLFHGAAKIDGDLPVGFLEIDQPRKNPEISRPFGHGDAHRAGGVVRRLRRAAKNIEGVTLHFHHVADHRGTLVA